jgi:UDP-2,4-diacetamido-2,4,6-trideoxy-beta-L-altropyranose hydrolase
MTTPSLGAYVDYGSAFGSGHASRQVALGSAWRKFGGSATVALDVDPSPRLLKQAQELGVDLRETVGEYDAIVVDSYVMPPDRRRELSVSNTSLELDDFLQVKDHHSDLFLDQNIGACEFESGRSTRGRSIGLYGPRFALLRPEFRLVQRMSEGPSRPWRIGLFTGGMAASPILDTIHAQLKRTLPSATVVPFDGSLTHVAEKMASLDLAVSAGGSTILELAAAGVPTLMFSIAENQRAVIREIAHRGLGFETTLERVDCDLATVLKNADALPEISARLMHLVDGRGADRVAAMLGASLLNVREVLWEDAALLFEWANDPQTRQNSFTAEEIHWTDHQAWLAAKLESPLDFLYIIEDAGTPIGHVRFAVSFDIAEISVNLNPAVRGKRYGARVLRAAIHKFRFEGPTTVRNIHARIKDTNAASLEAFNIASFVFKQQESDSLLFMEVSDDEIRYFRQ